MGAVVELDAFSGLPNPEWELTTEESDEFQRRLHELKDSDRRERRYEGLGFRGFKVAGLTGYEEVVVGKLTVWVRGTDGEESILKDPECRLARFLVGTAKGRVTEPPYVASLAEIEGTVT
ncbi:MAG: hypothetical protein ACHQPI_00415 [Thermoanaerobaculia bacterium]